MNWIAEYVVIGMMAAAVVSVIADRFRSDSGGAAALLSAFFWPVLVVGSAQLGLWVMTAELFRTATFGSVSPMRLRLEAPPL